ncbi:hypothetical protein [Actinoplanes subglobosus]|uniref:Uncharacterized protein n=1 Tax=Actinoplanes subglobosus TaxID=1547892 RepID=A0ABV8IME5_9ACTN
MVVNLTHSPTFGEASPAFFRTTMENLLSAAASAGVGHASPGAPAPTAAR